MDVTFLFGSGVSLPSELGSVEEITGDLLQGSYYEDRYNERIKQGELPGPIHYDLEPLQAFLKKIKNEYEEYLNEKLGDGNQSNYEDLYYLLDQIRDEIELKEINIALTPFINRIQEESMQFRQDFKPQDDILSLSQFCNKCMVFINSVIKYNLWDTDVREMDQLLELVNQGASLKIFTLNHDTLVEKLFNDNDISFVDGFSEPDGEVRWYKPDVYDDDHDNHIYHLHGARNWKRVRATENGKLVDRYAIMDGEDAWSCKREDGSQVHMLWDKGYILIGAGKASKYHYGMFEEYQYRFARHLRSTNRLIISGYGWNDYPINRKLKDWMLNDRDTKIMLVHDDPEQMVEDSRFLEFNFLERYGRQLELKCHWFGALSTEEIIEFING